MSLVRISAHRIRTNIILLCDHRSQLHSTQPQNLAFYGQTIERLYYGEGKQSCQILSPFARLPKQPSCNTRNGKQRNLSKLCCQISRTIFDLLKIISVLTISNNIALNTFLATALALIVMCATVFCNIKNFNFIKALFSTYKNLRFVGVRDIYSYYKLCCDLFRSLWEQILNSKFQ